MDGAGAMSDTTSNLNEHRKSGASTLTHATQSITVSGSGDEAGAPLANGNRGTIVPPIPASMKELANEQTDLLLDLAMTTAYNSLLDGVPINDWTSLASFVSIFVLIWWIWASQVLYHARFRERDWVHLVLYFVCQLSVFMCLTIFTGNFSITDGIIKQPGSTITTLDSLLKDQGWSQLAIDSQASRTARTPVRIVRGISMIMALSRVMVLVEYLCSIRRLLYRGPAKKQTTGDGHTKLKCKEGTTTNATASENRDRALNTNSSGSLWQRLKALEQKELWIHCGALVLSFSCYIAVFCLFGRTPTTSDQVARVCLWIAPILIEIASHLLVAQWGGWAFDAVAVYHRRSVIFTIVLGSGLDRMTTNFRFMIGNISFGPRRIFIIFCAGLIIIFLFTLHYTNIRVAEEVGNDNVGKRRRLLASFFLNFFYLCAVIVTLQGMNTLLRVSNVGDTLQTALGFLRESEVLLNSSGFTDPLLPQSYQPSTVTRLERAGYNVSALLAEINIDIPSPFPNDTTYPFKKMLLADMDIITSGLRAIDVLQYDDSLFSNEIYAFLDSGRIDASSNASSSAVASLTKQDFMNVVTTTFQSVANAPALWFAAAGGLLLVLLACMELLDHGHDLKSLLPARRRSSDNIEASNMERSSKEPGWTPRRKGRARWLQISGKVSFGLILIILTAVGNRDGGGMLNDRYYFVGSLMWSLAIQSWLLPIYVLILFVLQTCEYVVALLWFGPQDAFRNSLNTFKKRFGPFVGPIWLCVLSLGHVFRGSLNTLKATFGMTNRQHSTDSIA